VQQINGQREANPLLQALVSGLSCGPVGPSDQLGTMDFPTVHHICRGPDGYLNKPDMPAAPLDLTFQLGFEDVAEGLDSLPFVQHAWSEISKQGAGAAQRWNYLLAVDLKSSVAVALQDLGLPAGSRHLVFEYFSECWRNQSAVEKGYCTFERGAGHTTTLTALAPIALAPGGVRGDGLGGMNDSQARPFRYVLTAPIFENGWVLLGETGKFFIATTDRFSDLQTGAADAGPALAVTVHGAESERVTVELVAPAALAAAGLSGAGGVSNSDASTGAIATEVVHCQLSAGGEATLSCGGADASSGAPCACAPAGASSATAVRN